METPSAEPGRQFIQPRFVELMVEAAHAQEAEAIRRKSEKHFMS